MRYNTTRIVLVPNPHGGFKVRADGNGYPFIKVPLGTKKPMDVQIEGFLPALVDHAVEDGCLILNLPERVKLTRNTPTAEGK
jgi:hypothetical protein